MGTESGGRGQRSRWLRFRIQIKWGHKSRGRESMFPAYLLCRISYITYVSWNDGSHSLHPGTLPPSNYSEKLYMTQTLLAGYIVVIMTFSRMVVCLSRVHSKRNRQNLAAPRRARHLRRANSIFLFYNL